MTNEEFQYLLTLDKQFEDPIVTLPAQGQNNVFNLYSTTTKDKFLLDIDRRSKIEISKVKIQSRYSITKLPLVRIDFNGSPHINPDGTKVGRSHIHIYRQMENDTGNLPWAYELDKVDGLVIGQTGNNFMDIFDAFCEYSHISADNVQGVL